MKNPKEDGKSNREQEREAFAARMRENDAFTWRDDAEPGIENDTVANPLWRALPGQADKGASERSA